jgi:hypothetical protein
MNIAVQGLAFLCILNVLRLILFWEVGCCDEYFCDLPPPVHAYAGIIP